MKSTTEEKRKENDNDKECYRNRKITTRPNKAILSDKSTSIQFYGQWC